ncbi:spherical body protein, putative [Babesia ovata]|uniref:Spherical body protein, putative n=1 Tax=Babesia ovata TaxID=189622 RepID=A0A2H6KHS5_9APIC|nr:spherical body protein, putative [Babesia ovata]GBE62535.1 spherical body protein, putative [Babesia ovata]
MMFWLANIWCAVCVLVGCSASGMVLDLASDVLPEGVEAFYGTFSKGGVYRFIRGVEDLITEIRYGYEQIYFVTGLMGEVVYSHVEDFHRDNERYIRFFYGRNMETKVGFRSRIFERISSSAYQAYVPNLLDFIEGPILLPIDTESGTRLHPLMIMNVNEYCYGSVTYKVSDRFDMDTGDTVRMQLSQYHIGVIRVSQIKDMSLGCIAEFRIQCKKFNTLVLNQHYFIIMDNGIEIKVNMSRISKMNTHKASVSSSSSGNVLCSGVPSRSVDSEAILQRSLLSRSIGEGNNATAASASQVYTRSIYLFVPSQLEYAPLIEQFAMYDPSRNTVTYDMDFLVRHYEPQSVGNSRTTIHMTAAHAVVRSDSSSILLCAASQDPPSYSQAQVPPTEFTLTDAYGANEPFDLENFIIQLMPPGLETIADLLDASDIHIDDDEDDVSSGEFRSLISDLTPTFDQLALPVDHTFAEMEGNAFRG